MTDSDEYPLDDLLMECEEDANRHLQNDDSLIEGLCDPQTKEISKEGETKDDPRCIWCGSPTDSDYDKPPCQSCVAIPKISMSDHYMI